MLKNLNLQELFHREPQNFITRKEAAYLLGCAVSSVGRYIAEGKLPALRIGGRVLVYKPAVLGFPEEL